MPPASHVFRRVSRRLWNSPKPTARHVFLRPQGDAATKGKLQKTWQQDQELPELARRLPAGRGCMALCSCHSFKDAQPYLWKSKPCFFGVILASPHGGAAPFFRQPGVPKKLLKEWRICSTHDPVTGEAQATCLAAVPTFWKPDA